MFLWSQEMSMSNQLFTAGGYMISRSRNLALTGRNDHSEAFTKNSFTPSSDIKYEKTLLKKAYNGMKKDV